MWKLWIVDSDGNIRSAGSIICTASEDAEAEAYNRAFRMQTQYGIDIINVLFRKVS